MTVEAKNRHRARELQLQRQEHYFLQDLNETVQQLKLDDKVKEICKIIAKTSYKRGRLDR